MPDSNSESVEPTSSDRQRWAILSQPPVQVIYLVGLELVAVAWVAALSVGMGPPNGLDWLRFGLLLACAVLHNHLTRREEERRRSQTPTVHIDLTAVWTFPAVLVLPIHLALLLIVVVRAQRWLVGRRPLYKFVFSTTSIALAALAARQALDALVPNALDHVGTTESLWTFLAFSAAMFLYIFIQALLIGGALALGSAAPSLRSVFGSKEDNALDTVTVALGVVTALVIVTMPPALIIMLAVSVLGNRIAELKQLRVDVRTDPKTGLLNMVGWHETAQRELTRTQRSTGHLTVLMIDLDHFKTINDTWGHPAGDDVLQMVARSISQVTRPTDAVARFGGEEFVALLPGANLEQGMHAAERIRRTVMELQVVTSNKRGARTTISGRTTSIGVATYPNHAETVEALLASADSALYHAKENGRNQVRLASESQNVPASSALRSN